MADKLEGTAIIANTVSGDRIVTGSITTTQLAPSVASFVNAGQPLKIQTITYPGDDTAANTGGGQTIILSGSGFKQNVQVYINSNAVPSVTYANANAISFTTPALTAATYPVYVINTDDGATAILIPGIQYSGTPTWTTTTPLTTQQADTAWNIQLVATSDSAVSYSLQAGSSLPAGITLAANGLISGTMSSPPVDETTYNFTVVANDLEQQDASRAFSVSVTVTVLDPYFTYTTLLLHGDGTNNANNHAFVDSSTNNFAITKNGNASQGTFSPFGDNWSVYFDGNDHLNTASSDAFTLGASGASGDFTIEFWMYPDGAYSALTTLLSTYADYNSDFASRWSLNVITASNVLRWYNASGNIGVQTTPPPINTWTHVAIVRSGSTITMYINGTAVGTQTSGDGYTTQGSLKIGYVTGADYFKGYLSNVRIVKGTAVYTSNFTVPTQPLLPISNTSILTCESNAFVDDGPRVLPITVNGNPRITKFDPFKPYKAVPASYGVYFDGTGDYLSIADNTALDMGSSNFTIEGWYFPIGSASSSTAILAKRANSSTVGGVLLYYGGNGLTPSLLVDIGGSWAINQSSSVAFVANQWNHFAIVRNGSAFNLYINGVSGVSATNAGTIPDNASAFTIGAMGADGSGAISPCHISNFRIVKGTAVYTSTFTPPASPLTAIANTSLLTCQSTTIIDNSTNAFTITVNGNAGPTDLNPFTTTFVSEKYNTANVGGSGYFDGSGDWLSFGAQSAFNCGTSTDFCMEAWVYRIGSNMHIWSAHQAAVADGFYFTTAGFNVYSGGGGGAGVTSLSKTVPAYAWSHCVLTRQNDRLRYFLNGELIGTSTSSVQVNTDGRAVGINGGVNFTGDAGYIAGSRFIKGAVPIAYNTAVTTTNTQIFIPPSAPVTTTSQNANSSQVIALVNYTNAGIIDSVGKNVLETVGDARVNTSIKKFGTGSMYFDGTGDYLSAIITPDMVFGTGDMTIEAWVYPITTSGIDTIFDTRVSGGYGNDSFSFQLNDGALQAWAGSYSSGTPIATSGTVSTNTWTHVAFSRAGGVNNLFINGLRVITNGTSWNQTLLATNLYLIGESVGTGRPFHGHIDDLRITKGVGRYRYNFTPPTKTFNDGDGNLATLTSDVLVGDQVNLPVFPYTTLLLHGDGTNNANNHAFVDSSNNNFTITRNGNATQGTFSPFSPTGWSMYQSDINGNFPGFTTSVGSAFQFTGDFTIEGWVYPVSYSGTGDTSLWVTSSDNINYFALNYATSNYNIYLNSGSPNSFAHNIATNQWNHVAMVRSGSTITLYTNGVAMGTISSSATLGYATPSLARIGGGAASNVRYVSNLRIVKGTAVYTANFTPPTAPLTAVANTQLLTCQSNSFVDNSNNNFTATLTGSPSIQAFSPFAPSVEYTANTHGGSAYFDGSGDYLQVASGTNALTLTTNFTIEWWLYRTSNGDYAYIAQGGGAGDFNLTNGIAFQLYQTATTFYFDWNNGGSFTSITTAVANIPLNQWNHIALGNNGTTTRIWVNGTSVTSTTSGATWGTPTTRNVLYVGRLTHTAGYQGNGFISGMRVVTSDVYGAGNTTITVPIAPLTAITNTQLLTNYTNAGILDSTGKTVLETVGDTKVNTAIKKYGTGSMYFDGTGDQLTAYSTAQNLNALSSGDFTIEGWINTSTLAPAASYACIVGMQNYSGSTGWGIWQLNQTITVFFNAGSSTVTTGNVLTATGTWYHIAVTRSNGSVRVFINGTLAAGPTSISFSDSTTTPLTVGGISTATGWNANYPFYGYIDDLRITKGIARYVQNFTPPTAAFLNK